MPEYKICGILRDDNGTTFTNDFNSDQLDGSTPVSNNIFDLKIQQPIHINHASGLTTINLKYPHDYTDLEWTIDDWTTTTAVTYHSIDILSLAVGVHTLKVRLTADTTKEVSTTIERKSTTNYNLRWYREFDSIGNTQIGSTALTYRVEIYEKDFAGSSTEIKMGFPAFEITWDDEDGNDNFKPIRGSRCTLNLMSDTDEQFFDLATSSNDDFYVYIKQNSKIIWAGKIITDHYREPIAAPPYPVSVIAMDGLGLLKDMPFESLTGEPLEHELFSVRELIGYCLMRMQPAWDHLQYIQIPAFPDGKDNTTKPSTEWMHLDLRMFKGMNFYEVLETVLGSIGCYVVHDGRQVGKHAYWVIWHRRVTASHTYWIRGLYGNADDGTTSIDIRDNIGGLAVYNNAWCNQDQVKYIHPPVLSTKIVQFPIFSESIFPQDEITEDSFDASDNLKGWGTNPTDVDLEKYEYIDDEGVPRYGFRFSSKDNSPSTSDNFLTYVGHVPKVLQVDTATDEFKIKLDLEASIGFTSIAEDTSEWAAIPFMLAVGDYYLNKDFEWEQFVLDTGTSADDDFEFGPPLGWVWPRLQWQQSEVGGFKKFSIETPVIPWNTDQDNPIQVQLRFYTWVFSKPNSYWAYIKNLTCRLVPENNLTYIEREFIIENDNGASKVLEYENPIGYWASTDSPINIVQSMFLDDKGGAIEAFEHDTHSGDGDMLSVVATRMNNERKQPSVVIEGSVEFPGNDVNMITQPSINNVAYRILSNTWNPHYNISKLKMIKKSTDADWTTTDLGGH